MDAIWVERLKRLAAANARAHAERLRRMTLEDSLRAFEVHCDEMDRAFGLIFMPRSHPVGLVKYWKRS